MSKDKKSKKTKLNKDTFKALSENRIKEAKILLDNDCFEGAYYLMGYSIECALKAIISKQTRDNDFPDKHFVQKCHTHDLEELLTLADHQLKDDISSRDEIQKHWAVVIEWSETERYSTEIKDNKANDMYRAITDDKNGVLKCLKKYW